MYGLTSLYRCAMDKGNGILSILLFIGTVLTMVPFIGGIGSPNIYFALLISSPVMGELMSKLFFTDNF